jgi:poly(glycerol-phosphate) alpha-glucosyltransferase
MAVLEAWSYGLPVLMTPHCNLPEGFRREAAISAEPTVESLTRGLQQLMEMSDAVCRRMGTNGRALVEEQFTWPQVASKMLEVYEWVLGGGAPPACVEM